MIPERWTLQAAQTRLRRRLLLAIAAGTRVNILTESERQAAGLLVESTPTGFRLNRAGLAYVDAVRQYPGAA